MRDATLESLAGVVVLAWRSGEDGLRLNVRGQGDEVRLRCRCDRSHWIVREQVGTEGTRLLVSCHNCGRSGRWAIEGAVPSAV